MKKFKDSDLRHVALGEILYYEDTRWVVTQIPKKPSLDGIYRVELLDCPEKRIEKYTGQEILGAFVTEDEWLHDNPVERPKGTEIEGSFPLSAYSAKTVARTIKRFHDNGTLQDALSHALYRIAALEEKLAVLEKRNLVESPLEHQYKEGA
jgi:hypothetical protein